MKASIVVDNYNYGRFLRDAIDSALAQTYPHTEVIVVDDGSTDESRDVIMSYGGAIVSVLQENGGQGSALNAGFEASSGDVVAFLDADDWLEPDALADAVPLFDRSVVRIGWRLRIVGEHGIPTDELFPDGEMPNGSLRSLAIDSGPIYDTHHIPPLSGNVWSRRFLEQVMPVPPAEFRYGADVYLHTLAPVFGDLLSLSLPRGFYRVHGSNNYWNHPLTPERIDRYEKRFDSCCVALQRVLAEQGVQADVEAWRKRNWNHLWMSRLKTARAAVERLIPEGESYILVDDQDLGGGFELGDRVVHPFLERDGVYWGPPPDDEAAIEALDTMRADRVGHIAFWFPCFWWLDAYPRLEAYLNQTATPVHADDALRMWRLAPRAG